jgi:hypothetical protein
MVLKVLLGFHSIYYSFAATSVSFSYNNNIHVHIVETSLKAVGRLGLLQELGTHS